MKCFHSSIVPLEADYAFAAPLWKGGVSREMLIDDGVLLAEEVIDCEPLPSGVMEAAHSTGYLAKIVNGQLDLKEELLLGLKVTPRVFPQVSSSVNATISSCLTALSEGVGLSLSGGMHNAYADFGLNYSIFNDVAIAVKVVRNIYPEIRIMVVDTDADHGSGTNSLLTSDPLTYTFSLHAFGSKKVGCEGSMDVTVARYLEGESYMHVLSSYLADALEEAQPDLVIWISGVSAHYLDRSRLMRLNADDLMHRDLMIARAFIKNQIPLCVLLGGGVNENPVLTAKLHRNTVAAIKHVEKECSGLKKRAENPSFVED